MKISALIEQLKKDLEKHGDIEVIIAQESPFNGLSTVEDTYVIYDWVGNNAIILDWRT